MYLIYLIYPKQWSSIRQLTWFITSMKLETFISIPYWNWDFVHKLKNCSYDVHYENCWMVGCLTEQPKHVQNIQRVRQILLESIRRTGRIVAQMYQETLLSERERQLVECQHTLWDKAERLINLIESKPVQVYQSFKKALKDTNQEFLCRILENTGYILYQIFDQMFLNNKC